jgi:hypothetical protein
VKGYSTVSEVRIRVRDSPLQMTDRADREKTAGEGITKKNQEPECRAENMTSPVCAVRDCATNKCSSAR